jgi:DNA polymerase/3'-5' exonuclease PolX
MSFKSEAPAGGELSPERASEIASSWDEVVENQRRFTDAIDEIAQELGAYLPEVEHSADIEKVGEFARLVTTTTDAARKLQREMTEALDKLQAAVKGK